MLVLEGVVICGCEAPLLLDAPARGRGGRRLPATPYPDTYERTYRAALRPLLKDLADATDALVADLDRYTTSDAPRIARERAAALRRKVESMRAEVLKRWTSARIVRTVPVDDITEGVDRMNSEATWQQLVKAVELSPLDVPEDSLAFVRAADGSLTAAKREAWIRANVKLIKSVAEEHLDRVAEITEQAVKVGSRAEVVAERLREATGISSRKARTIARDQIATLQGQVVQARQTRLGIERYRWRTAGDSRVRTAHQLREGQIFRWDRPPNDGHPGQPINCRCYAEPVLDDVLAALAGE